MSKIYHFTSIFGMKEILKSQSIKPFLTVCGKHRHKKAVCLTTDKYGTEQGLFDGRELTKEQAGNEKLRNKAIEVDGKYYCINQREFRLTFQKEKLGLVNADSFYESEEFKKVIAITAFYPLGDAEDIKHKEEVEKMFYDKNFTGKFPTWFFSYNEINLKCLTSLERLSNDGHYNKIDKNNLFEILKEEIQKEKVYQLHDL